MTGWRLNLIALLLVAGAGAWLGRCSAPAPELELRTLTDTVEIAPAALLRRVADLQLEADGLRSRLAGRERRAPRVIMRTDTVITAPDTVYAPFAVRSGELHVPLLIDTLGGRRIELHTTDVADCDDGYSIGPAGVVCDRARFGHIDLYGSARIGVPLTMPLGLEGAGLVGELGLGWEPSFRSTLRLELAATTRGVAVIRLRKGWRLF